MKFSRNSAASVAIVGALLSLWLFYGSLEVAEELHILVKVQPSAQDPDLEALAQLASGIRPDVPAMVSPSQLDAAPAITLSAIIPGLSLSSPARCELVYRSLALHQRLRVYRI